MANSVFLDTNGWLALLNSRDSLHERADSIWRGLGAAGYGIVLTDWVVAETGNGLARSNEKGTFAAAVKRILESPRSKLIFVDEELMHTALDEYAHRTDKTWGLVDCLSFAVMRSLAITEAMTNDRHFEQAGFVCLL